MLDYPLEIVMLTDQELTLDETRLAAAFRALAHAQSDWATQYWANVRQQLKNNMKWRMSGGTERQSNITPNRMWSHG